MPENQIEALSQDEALFGSAQHPFIGNFHKTLPHDEFGEVTPSKYRDFVRLCLEVAGGLPRDFESVPEGSVAGTAADHVAKLVSPLAGAATEHLGPEPRRLHMPPPPGVHSASAAAELTELYWMALLRDEPLASFAGNPHVDNAITELQRVFGRALREDQSLGGLKLGLDLPGERGSGLSLNAQTLFRCGLQDEQHGPLVSQFFLQDIPYGAQTITSKLRPYTRARDFLTSYADWLRAQNSGYDAHARDYGHCNYHGDDHGYYASKDRYTSTMRDLARFVNRDALHQAYFNAALFLDAAGADLDEGNPYFSRYKREGGFATLGGPDLLTLVSEVSSRALKVVWRQKWLVYRRCRPEAYAGLAHMQWRGLPASGATRDYGLPQWLEETEAAQAILAKHNTLFLPMAFTAGSPVHPAYGAGHACVAGACVTVLKAWFDETQSFESVLGKAADAHRDPFRLADTLLQPGALRDKAADEYEDPSPYVGNDKTLMTVGGELNKLAANVAMGRSMGGVHYRTDNTRGLRLGEQVAIEILRKRTEEYAERRVSFTFRSFDRQLVQISDGRVRIA